jgi:hypothetical protein
MRAPPWSSLLLLLLLPLAASCAGRTTEGDTGPRPPTAADRALACATAVAQAGGFKVRPRDPRIPLLVIADRGAASGGMAEVIVVRVTSSVDPEQQPMLTARVQGPRLGSSAGSDVEDTARRIESRCGGDPGRPQG